MSIKSTVVAEVQRNTATPKPRSGSGAKTKSDALVDSIPTEILAPYTGLLALIVANAKGGSWEVGRWIMYVICVALVPATVWFLWRRSSGGSTGKRKAPVAGMVGSTLAFAAWGLVMPGAPLTFSVTDSGSLTIWTGIIITVTTFLIGFLPLTKKAIPR